MAWLVIFFWLFILIGAFLIHPVLGIIVLLFYCIALGGGFNSSGKHTSRSPSPKPTNKPQLTPEQERERREKAAYYEKLHRDLENELG